MERVIIEIKYHGVNHCEYRIIDKCPVNIGRGFDNHIILSDPYVSLNHLSLNSSEDGWQLTEKGGENGVTVGEKSYTSETFLIGTGEAVQCGHTVLRFYEEEFKPAPTRLLHRLPVFMQRLSSPYPSLLFLILMCLFAALSFWMDSYSKDFFSKVIGLIAVLLMLNMVWTTGWAFVGHVLKHKANFFGQMSICSLFCMWIFLFSDVGEYVAYLFNSHFISFIINVIHVPLGVALLFYGSMSIATSMPRTSKMALTVTLAMLLASVMISSQMDGKVSRYPKSNKSLYPPELTPVKGESLERFIKDAGRLYKQ